MNQTISMIKPETEADGIVTVSTYQVNCDVLTEYLVSDYTVYSYLSPESVNK